MASSDELDSIRTQVERNLEAFRNLDDEELFADVGPLALRDVRFAAPLPREGLAALGRMLVNADERVREVVCSNKGLISASMDITNVTALVTLLAPTLGFPPAAVPASIVALAVLILRIGLNQYCKGKEGGPTTS